jgi:hypothetical protein
VAESAEAREWQRIIRASVRECLETWLLQAQAGPVTAEALEEAQRIIGEFIGRYNAEWLIERLGHRTHPRSRVRRARGVRPALINAQRCI